MGIFHCIHQLLLQQQAAGVPLNPMHTPPLGNPLEIQALLQSGKSGHGPRLRVPQSKLLLQKHPQIIINAKPA